MASVDSNTVLLVHSDYEGDASSTGFTDSSSNALSVTPTAVEHSQVEAKLGASSIKFDAGVADILSVADNAVLDIGTGDFTVDFWANFDAIETVGINYAIVNRGSYPDGTGKWNIVASKGGAGISLTFYWSDGSSQSISEAGLAMSNSTWYHIAVIRESNHVDFYLGGVKQGSGGTCSTSLNGSDTIDIGSWDYNGSWTLGGYLDEIRFSNTARWSTNFSVPTAAYTSDANTIFLIHSNYYLTTFTDSGASANAPHTLTAVADAQHKTAQAKFGASSIYFDGTGDRITATDAADYDVGTGDFTIDAWIRANSFDTDYFHVIASRGTTLNVSGAWTFVVYNNSVNDVIFFKWYDGSETTFSQNTDLTAAQWHHVAVVRASGQIYLFVDGTLLGNQAHSASLSSAEDIWIGQDTRHYTTWLMKGYIDEFRYSSSARWTTSFTPPAAPYGGETVALTSQSLTLTQYSATALINTTVSLSSQALTLAQYSASINSSPTVALSSIPLTLTQYGVEAISGAVVGLSSQALTLTQYAASVIYPWTETLSSQALTLTQYSPTVIIPVTVALNSQSLTLTQYASTTRQVNSAGHVQITTTGIKPLIETGGNKPIVTTTAGG